MDEISQTNLPRVSNPSSTTGILVVVYHFVVSAALIVGLVAFYKMYGLSDDAPISFKVVSAILLPFVLLYLAAGWGILKRKNWGRILSLVLNWGNLVGAVVNFSRFHFNPEAVIGAILSCLSIWWLSKSAVKIQFRSATAIQ
jgi:hypothetical protein